MIFHHQVEQDKTFVVMVVENMTTLRERNDIMHHVLVAVLIIVRSVTVTSNTVAAITKKAIAAVITRVGATEVVTEMATDADQEEQIITEERRVVVSIRKVEAIEPKITTIMMTITHLGDYRGSQKTRSRLRVSRG